MGLWDYGVRDDSDMEAVTGMAKKLGLDGLCILSDGVKLPSGNSGVEIVSGMLVDANNANLMRKNVRKSRKKYEVIAVLGKDDAMNRVAAETAEIDILIPASGTKIDVVMAKLARKNNVKIGFEFGILIHSTLEERGRLFSQMLKNAKAVKKFGAPFVVVSGALSEFGLRAPSELVAFGMSLGFDEPDIRKGMSGNIIEENRKRLSGKWVMPGVEVEK